MKMTNISEVKDFLSIIPECKGDVWVESVDGDRFNLKSSLSCYIAIGRIIEERGADLELFCSDHGDEQMFYDYFARHPGAA